MASFKATIFQKNINTEISKDQKVKILAQKSDFLVMPELFPLMTKNSTLVNLASNSRKNLDNLIDLSMQYKGVIIGGSFIREEDGKYYHSSPIVSDGLLVDWYNQKSLSPALKDLGLSKGLEDEGIYILNGIRFAILTGRELDNPAVLEHIKNEGIQIIFHLDSDPENSLTLDEDLKKYAKITADYQFYIFRSCGTGAVFEKPLKGRSLYSSPAGINWKVAPSEEETEIIKTINLNF